MIRKYMFLPLVVSVLSIVFFIVSFFVFVSGGNDRLIKIKLAIGALILTFTTFSTPAFSSRTCYEPVIIKVPVTEVNEINIQNAGIDKDNVKINIQENNKLFCTINNPTCDKFSYCIIGENGAENQKGNIDAIDGAFDEFKESFRIEISKDIAPGNYTLFIYGVPEEEQTKNLDEYIGKYSLRISN